MMDIFFCLSIVYKSVIFLGDFQSWEKSFCIVIDIIFGLVWFGSVDGLVEFFNKQWCEYIGIVMDDVFGWGWICIIYLDDLLGLEVQWCGVMIWCVFDEFEVCVCCFDGEYCWFFFCYVLLFDVIGQVFKWYGVNIDIEGCKCVE